MRKEADVTEREEEERGERGGGREEGEGGMGMRNLRKEVSYYTIR